jgi:toxin ParE1/3/4
VSSFRFTRAAERDLEAILTLSRDTFGVLQAARYRDKLIGCCARVAATPGIARACDHVRPGYLRLEEGRHVLFLEMDADGVLIVRVLHDRMDPLLHIDDSDEDE